MQCRSSLTLIRPILVLILQGLFVFLLPFIFKLKVLKTLRWKPSKKKQFHILLTKCELVKFARGQSGSNKGFLKLAYSLH